MGSMKMGDWIAPVLGFFDSLWRWMTPGLDAALTYLPAITPLLALLVA